MTTVIDSFKKIMFDLDISGGITQQYSLSNDIANTNSCFLNFNLNTSVQNKIVTITIQHYSALNGTLENTETYNLNYRNKSLSRNINLISAYTLISIDYTSFNGILSGFIEKMVVGNNTLSVDISGQRVISDISGQKVDVSGQYLNVYVQNTTTNLDDVVGFNIYQIRPKTIMYVLSGQNSAAITNGLMSGPSSVLAVTTYDFGLINTRTTWRAILTGFSGTLNYEYINNSGNLAFGSISLTNGANTSIGNSIVSINKWSLSSSLGTSQSLVIRPSDVSNNNITGGNNSAYYTGVITIPNNAIGFVSNLAFYAVSGTNISLYKWDASGVRSVVYTIYNASNVTTLSGYEGSIGGIFYPGESVGWGRAINTTAEITSNIVIKYVS